MKFRQIHLVSRPSGPAASLDNFAVVSCALPASTATMAKNSVLVRNAYLSLDPYMRMRMSDVKSYAAPQPLNAPMLGGTVGQVALSNFDGLKVGDWVKLQGGWAEYTELPGKACTKITVNKDVPASAHLSVLGMPGVTAFYGMRHLIRPKAGDTVVVSAAAGAVGSCAGQLAKLAGCRVVGLAGGADKCAVVVRDFGFDACLDYKAHATPKELQESLARECPSGVDGYFDNVGGDVLNAVMPLLNPFARVAVCGAIANYQAAKPVPLLQPNLILTSRLQLTGFIISEQPKKVWDEAQAELERLVAQRTLKWKETVEHGLENAPKAFLSLLRGGNVGKQLVAML